MVIPAHKRGTEFLVGQLSSVTRAERGLAEGMTTKKKFAQVLSGFKRKGGTVLYRVLSPYQLPGARGSKASTWAPYTRFLTLTPRRPHKDLWGLFSCFR